MVKLGVFDSGLGGLTVVAELKKKRPGVQIVYLGDTARVPYGTRSPETIIRFSMECARFLADKGVEKLIIACNTASAYAYEEIKKIVKIPVLEMISYGAAGTVGYKKIGVIGTPATIKSGAYEREIKKINLKAVVKSIPAPLLVPLVEAGEVKGELAEIAVRKYLNNFKGFGMEALVLGCTHYPWLRRVIAGQIGKGVKLVDPARELANNPELVNETGEGSGDDIYYLTDVTETFLAQGIMGKMVKVEL